MKKLKRCPFCGHIVKVYSENNKYSIKCSNCHILTPSFNKRKEVEQLWNTRTPLRNVVRKIEEKIEICNNKLREEWFLFEKEKLSSEIESLREMREELKKENEYINNN